MRTVADGIAALMRAGGNGRPRGPLRNCRTDRQRSGLIRKCGDVLPRDCVSMREGFFLARPVVVEFVPAAGVHATVSLAMEQEPPLERSGATGRQEIDAAFVLTGCASLLHTQRATDGRCIPPAGSEGVMREVVRASGILRMRTLAMKGP